MSARVDKIDGIGPVYRSKLEAAGIHTTDDLIERCGSPLRRREVAALTGLREQQLFKWVRTADLMQLRGVGREYSQLLDASGATSVATLRTRDAEKLHTRMSEVNEFKKLARRTPTLPDVTAWIVAARAMEPRVY